MSISLDDVYPFSPAGFVHCLFDVEYASGIVKTPHKKPFLLPHAEFLLGEEIFADVALWYNLEGVHLSIMVHKAFEDVSFPQVTEGDSVELFFDTRDLKEIGSIHKFCHHFIFLPKEVGGMVACEMTKFRADDSHPLCDPKLLELETIFSKRSYEMKMLIRKEALYGFDPMSVSKMGFAYRINRKGAPPQHFTVSSVDYALEKYPSLWASLKLKPKALK